MILIQACKRFLIAAAKANGFFNTANISSTVKKCLRLKSKNARLNAFVNYRQQIAKPP
jgi:hypothetical protein